MPARPSTAAVAGRSTSDTMRRSTLALLAAMTTCRLPWPVRADPPIVIEDDHPLLTDPDLPAALETFLGMSPEEREEAMQGLLAAVGDDPVQRAEMERLLATLPAMNEEQLKGSHSSLYYSLNKMDRGDEVAQARENARQTMGGVTWDFFVENQAAILEATIADGQLSAEDAARFRTDGAAWLKQLRVIYDDIKGHAEL